MLKHACKFLLIGVTLLMMLTVSGGLTFAQDPQPDTVELLPQPTSGFPPGIAPESARVDIVKPTFSNPTSITNPLLPITEVDQLIQVGHKDGQPHRTEFTLLPSTKIIEWHGEQTEVRALQFVAYLDGRILETAIDYLAQADGGAVWYFGEDVANYEAGVIADHEGTWLAGKDGPPAMIMPANPQVGNVYRVENIPGNVFEEVTVKAVNQTLEGPRGLITGVMFVQQVGLDGKTTVKAFAPGYGEFLAHSEDAAIAVPIDALASSLPEELKTLLSGANSIFDAVAPEDWDAISTTLAGMTETWEAHQSAVDLGSLFPVLDEQMAQAFNTLREAVEQRNPADTRKAAFAVAVATLDLQMPYRPLAEVDLTRFDLWARQTLLDAAAASPGDVAGDITVLGLIWDRVGHTVDAATAEDIAAQLGDLRAAADDEDLDAAADAAARLRDTLAALKLTSETDSPEPSIANINPADFVDVVDNPYYPRIPGTKYVYEGKTKEGLERSEREVLLETREVMGIAATVVRDRVYMDGALIEDTYEWFAQDKAGNVWFLGEDVKNYENGVLVDTAGSWEAGVDGALPGIVMFADPATHIGETYHQQYYKGVAEDTVNMLSVSERVTVPYSSFDHVVQTKDYTTLEPDIVEHKFYAKGIGVVKTVDLNTGEELVLVKFIAS
jgi:hypothetical protein